MKKHGFWGFAVGSFAALCGCALPLAAGGFGQTPSHERIAPFVAPFRDAAQTEADQMRVAELLKTPLSVGAAVEVALLSNRDLQDQLAHRGLTGASFVRADRQKNSGLIFADQGGGAYDRIVMFDLLDGLAMAMARPEEHKPLEAAQFQVVQDAVTLVANTRHAYFAAVGSREQLHYLQQVKETADIAHELAKRMTQAGNFNRLTLLREQIFYADITAQLMRAQQQAVVEREQLVRLLGLTGDQARFQLPDRLPELPVLAEQALDVRHAEQTAMDKRLDIQRAKYQTHALASALGLTRSTRMINVLAWSHLSRGAKQEQKAYESEVLLELPIFDVNAPQADRVDAIYFQAINRVAALGLQARSEVRERHAAYRAAYALARHYRDEVVPLRKRISEENLLRYNGMLISVFELLADAREQVMGVSNAVAALRDFWVSQVDLDRTLTAGAPSASIALPRNAPPLSPAAAAGH